MKKSSSFNVVRVENEEIILDNSQQEDQQSESGTVGQDLGRMYEEFARDALHLQYYVYNLLENPNPDVGSLQFKAVLTRDLGFAKIYNLIYPAGNESFVHAYKGSKDPCGNYKIIEPRLPDEYKNLTGIVEEKFSLAVDEKIADEVIEDREAVLRRIFESTVIPIRGVSGVVQEQGNTLLVSEELYPSLRYEIFTDKVGLGRIETMMKDPYLEDISCNGIGSVFVEHKIFGSMKTSIEFFAQEDLDAFITRLCERVGKPVSRRRPIVDASLPDGSRLNVVFGEDVSRRGSNFTIRKFSKVPMSIVQLIKYGTLDARMAAYLWMMLENNMSMFICGETASGKTTTLNAVTVFIRPTARIVSIEDTPELFVPHPNWVNETTRRSETQSSSIELFDLLKSAMRQRPNYIIVGEIRSKEGNVAFQAIQTGHPVISTFHASSMQKLIQRLTGDPINIPPTYVDNLNIVIFQTNVKNPKTNQLQRRVTGIHEIVGMDPVEKTYNFIELFTYDPLTDKHTFRGVGNSFLLEYKVAPLRRLSHKDYRKIYDELELRAYVMKRLVDLKVEDYNEVYGMISKLYENPYLTSMYIDEYSKQVIDRVLKGVG